MVDVQAPISFFDVTPVGRILNRFSSDVFSVDDTLPFILNIFLAQTFSLLGVIVVCCYGLPYIALLIAPLTVIYYFIQVSCYCCLSYFYQMSSDVKCDIKNQDLYVLDRKYQPEATELPITSDPTMHVTVTRLLHVCQYVVDLQPLNNQM